MADGTNSGETLIPSWAPEGAGKVTKLRLNAITSDENVAVPLNVDGRPFYYKRHLTRSERKWVSHYRGEGMRPLSPVTPLTQDEAPRIAKELNQNYQIFKIAFADHAADTQFIVGSSRDEKGKDRGDILVQAVQERVKVFPSSFLDQAIKGITPEARDSLLRKAKEKTLLELRESKDPNEKILAAIISEHQPALHDFYRAYIDAILLGVIPDLRYWPDPHKSGGQEVGLLFSENIGIVSDEQGGEKVVVFDFGSPRKLIDLSPEARQRLKNLIDWKRSGDKPELPIILTRTIVNYYDNEDGKAYDTDVTIAPWYEEALRRELGENDDYINFLQDVFRKQHYSNERFGNYDDLSSTHGIGNPTDEVEIDRDEGRINWYSKHLSYELEVWRRLTKSPYCATEVAILRDSSGASERGRGIPDEYKKSKAAADGSI